MWTINDPRKAGGSVVDLLCGFVCMLVCIIVKYKTTSCFKAETAGQLCNIAKIKHRFLSNGGYSVRFLNRFRQTFKSTIRTIEIFFPSLIFSR